MFTLNILEDCGYGCFLLSDGEYYIWDFAENGIDGVLQNQTDGTLYDILDITRDSDDNPLGFVL